MNRLALGLACAILPLSVHAHSVRAPIPGNLLVLWQPETTAVATLVAVASLYARGVYLLWGNAGKGAAISTSQVGCFAFGWTLLALATTSPLHTLGVALFSAHMAQHEIIVAAAAPLLVLGRPTVAFAWAIPRGKRDILRRVISAAGVRRSWRIIRGVPAATVLHGLVLWLWHVPMFYEFSVTNEAMHALQHALFLGTAILFWMAVLPRRAAKLVTSSSSLSAVGALFATVLHTGMLGALMTFSSRLWYPYYGATTAPWGLMPLEDQQLAGLIMWIPGSVTYVGAALFQIHQLLKLSPLPSTQVVSAT